jgi:hypothetical protein
MADYFWLSTLGSYGTLSLINQGSSVVMLCPWRKGWCVGRNPPFVQCGIRLIGLPALQVVPHQRLFALSTCRTAVSPLRIQHSRQLSMPHWHLPDGRFVSAPEPRPSPYALADVATLLVGGVSSSLLRSSKATCQLASP